MLAVPALDVRAGTLGLCSLAAFIPIGIPPTIVSTFVHMHL
jgi:hypothetical protein